MECFIEAVTPETREPLLEIMEALRQDRENGWVMQSDGSYILEEGGKGTSSQDRLYRYFSERIVENDPEPTREEETEQAKKNGFFAGLLRLFGWK